MLLVLTDGVLVSPRKPANLLGPLVLVLTAVDRSAPVLGLNDEDSVPRDDHMVDLGGFSWTQLKNDIVEACIYILPQEQPQAKPQLPFAHPAYDLRQLEDGTKDCDEDHHRNEPRYLRDDLEEVQQIRISRGQDIHFALVPFGG